MQTSESSFDLRAGPAPVSGADTPAGRALACSASAAGRPDSPSPGARSAGEAPAGLDGVPADPGEYPLWCEPKADGFFVEARRESEAWTFRSRGGLALELPHLAEALAGCGRLRGLAIVQGEVMGASFSAVRSGARSARSAWLLVHDAAVGPADRRPLLERLVDRGCRGRSPAAGPLQLAGPLGYLGDLGRLCQDPGAVDVAYHDFRAAGWEGLVAKRPGAFFGECFHRVKPLLTVDGRLVAIALARRAGVVLSLDVAGRLVRVPVQGAAAAEFRAVGSADALRGAWIEFTAQERLPSGAYRHPRFIRLRPDKQSLVYRAREGAGSRGQGGATRPGV